MPGSLMYGSSSAVDIGPGVFQTAQPGPRESDRMGSKWSSKAQAMNGSRLPRASRAGLIVLAMVAAIGTLRADEGRVSRPNVVIILADDLGFSDLGCYGGEIRTPRLDGLAAGGLRFTQFYNTARCWPSRAAMLTGYYAQQVRRDTVPGVKSGGRRTRPAWAKLLPERLRPLGYRSYHSGKWHVDGMPLANGFDRSYYVEDLGRYFHPRVLFEDDRRLPPVAPGSGYYATTAIADHAIGYLAEHAEQHRDRPFFLYLAFNAPAFPPAGAARGHRPLPGRVRSGLGDRRARRDGLRIREMGLVRRPALRGRARGRAAV